MKQIILTTVIIIILLHKPVEAKQRSFVVDIPAGRVEKIVTEDETIDDRITLNNKTIFNSDSEITNIKSIHKLYDMTLIIVERACRGNGSSCWPKLTLLTIYNNGKCKIYNIVDEFMSYEISKKGKYVFIKAPIGSSKILYVKYSNGKVTKNYKKITGKFPEDDCKHIYEVYKECSNTKVKKNPFKEMEAFHKLYWGWLWYYSEDARFNRNKFNQSCVDASRSGKVMTYASFGKNICH